MKRSQVLVPVVVAMLALALSGCSSSPTSPSSVNSGVNLHGLAMGQSSASASSAGGYRAMSTGSSITVTVEGTSISTTISGNGSFELDGLPAGTFTLVFSSNTVTLGKIMITSVPTQAEINLVVQITTTVIMVKVEINGTDETDNENGNKTCLINGGTEGSPIELEGSVKSLVSGSKTSFLMSVNGERADGSVTVDAAGASFDCAGVKGNACDGTLIQPGAKVHVSGSLTSCSTTAAQVKATQVKFQH